jgi:hypothetical protein
MQAKANSLADARAGNNAILYGMQYGLTPALPLPVIGRGVGDEVPSLYCTQVRSAIIQSLSAIPPPEIWREVNTVVQPVAHPPRIAIDNN